ncbi:MAG: methyltransferase domain-containing protein [Lachnospiraceae bacterium]|nr:methyltransferase domain-containing protein [Lachnospiraceae bacterium]
MEKYIIFGAGQIGYEAVRLIGKDNIEFVIDNDKSKKGTTIGGVTIKFAQEYIDEIKDRKVIIAVGKQIYNEIEKQLSDNGISNIIPFEEISRKIIKSRIQNRTDYLAIYSSAIDWIMNNTVDEPVGKAIINNSDLPKGYPEVTGYYIPSLIRAGYRDLAVEYAKWLCSIQHNDGSWWDTDDHDPYTFDSGQILKGLLAVRGILPAVDQNIIRGCDWLISNIDSSGRMITENDSAIGDKNVCSELIHLYCLSPLVEAADVFHRPQYKKAAQKVLNYYKSNYYDDIVNFKILSHFYAYIIEAMVDLGETDIARKAMDNVAKLQTQDGAVPAYQNVHWVCSTGLFQFAVIWFKLGDREHGEKAFKYAMSLQNESGGWYGSYQVNDKYSDELNDYFPLSEISWAVKYFLDALYYKNVADFAISSPQFFDTIDRNEGRYQAVYNEVKSIEEGGRKKIIDVGCSRGRYIKNLIEDFPENEYYGVDIATTGMDTLTDKRVHKKAGSLTCVPYPDDYFDMAYVCEALEHCVDVESSIRELARVVKLGGKILIVDKNVNALGEMEIEEWEQWFSSDGLKNIMSKYCENVQVNEDIPYDDKHCVFTSWCGIVENNM